MTGRWFDADGELRDDDEWDERPDLEDVTFEQQDPPEADPRTPVAEDPWAVPGPAQPEPF